MQMTIADVGKVWIAKLPSESKLIKWSVGDDYKVVYVRPEVHEGQRRVMVTFEPATQPKGFREQTVISEDIFLKCFTKK
jgi:hypothetical protein